jgi:hypothetical protein
MTGGVAWNDGQHHLAASVGDGIVVDDARPIAMPSESIPEPV